MNEKASYGRSMLDQYLNVASYLNIITNTIINNINNIKSSTNQNYNDALKYSMPILSLYNDGLYYFNLTNSNYNSRFTKTNSGSTTTNPVSYINNNSRSNESTLSCGSNYYSISDTKCCPNNTIYDITNDICEGCPSGSKLNNHTCMANTSIPATVTTDKVLFNQTYYIPKNKSNCKPPNELYKNKCWAGCNNDPSLKSFQHKCYNCPNGYSYDKSKSNCVKCPTDTLYNSTTNTCESNSYKPIKVIPSYKY